MISRLAFLIIYWSLLYNCIRWSWLTSRSYNIYVNTRRVCQIHLSSYISLKLGVALLIQCSAKCLISLRKCTKMIEVYLESMKHFKYRYFLVTLLNEVAHAHICIMKLGISYLCLDIFTMLWHHTHFLEDLVSYVYKIYYLSQEEIYLKRKLVYFFEGFVYVDKVVPFDATIKK